VDAECDLLAPDLRYLFVPVWVVRLRVGRHPYAFVVDAVRGRILSGRAPEAPRRGALFVVLVAAYLGFPLGKVAALAASGRFSGIGEVLGGVVSVAVELGPILLLVPAFLLFPIAFAWGEFRFRGEVAFEPGGVRVVKSSRPRRTFLERLIDRMVETSERWTDEWMRNQAERDASWGKPW
jgi:hypothetical protein